jgi:putative nucleotidyltransferase with HDIG domain
MILVCETFADLYPIVYFGFGDAQTEVTVSLGITFAVACIWPPEQAMLLVLIQTVASDFITHKSLDKVVFNGALYATVIGGTSIIYHHFAMSQVNVLEGTNLLAIGLAAGFYTLAECAMLSGLFSTLSHRPLLEVFVSFFKQSWLDFAALLPLGMVMVALFRENPLSILFLVPTFLLLYFSLKREQMLRSQTEAVLAKLVDVLESKSPETAQHSKRVRAWVSDMCRELGMESSESDMVLQAAVLHDLGKVGLDDGLLRKPGLSADEFHQIMGHPAVSAALLEGLTLFQGGRDIVLHHHERYDGNGYPDHLAGENIPLGARIIAVADSFDAMVSIRPYRAKSLTVRRALKILDEERGAQFDPDLVTAFTKLVNGYLNRGDMSNFPAGVQVDSLDEADATAGVSV